MTCKATLSCSRIANCDFRLPKASCVFFQNAPAIAFELWTVWNCILSFEPKLHLHLCQRMLGQLTIVFKLFNHEHAWFPQCFLEDTCDTCCSTGLHCCSSASFFIGRAGLESAPCTNMHAEQARCKEHAVSIRLDGAIPMMKP